MQGRALSLLFHAWPRLGVGGREGTGAASTQQGTSCEACRFLSADTMHTFRPQQCDTGHASPRSPLIPLV
jgi:hypothetical protein